MPWFIQLIMAIFMIILYSYIYGKRIVHFYCYFGYYNIVFIIQSSIGEL